MNVLKRYLVDFSSLFFPRLCSSCRTDLTPQEHFLCISCLYNLPVTDFHLHEGNTIEKIFWGRVKIKAASAFLFFRQKGKVQHMMHQLKYHGNAELGVFLGKLYGQSLVSQEAYKNADLLIPVPLHPKKHKKRGYNQSEKIAEGLSSVLNIPVNNTILKRIKQIGSQVGKSRIDRVESLKECFLADCPEGKTDKVILIDDTITTGSTLEACVLALNNIGIENICILSLAYAE